jgi:ribosomal protein S18 acetylase RimI-like enzyme
MGTPSLRPGTAEDAAAVADMWHSGWHDAHPGHVPDGLTERRTLEAFHERAPLRVADTTVATVDGEVAGFIMVVDDEVEQIYVDSAHRGSGLARLLLDEAERQVAAGGHRTAWLAVVVGNERARAFYERQGWIDGGDLPYEVTALGHTYLSPCRRYIKRVV